MTAVRLYTYRGLVAVPVVTYNVEPATTLLLPAQPYLAAELIEVTGDAVSSSAASAPAGTALLVIEIAGGGSVRFEINPPGRKIVASATSPRLLNGGQYTFGAGWTVSLIAAWPDHLPPLETVAPRR